MIETKTGNTTVTHESSKSICVVSNSSSSKNCSNETTTETTSHSYESMAASISTVLGVFLMVALISVFYWMYKNG